MIGSTDDCLAYANFLESEHRRLQGVVRRIQAVWSDSLQLPEGELPAGREMLIGCLTDLHQQLDRHFQQEEEGGCLEEAVSRRPALAAQAEMVESEHSQLLKRLDQLIQALRPKVTAGELAQLAPQFEEFCHALRAHEASESEILERGFNFNIEEAQ